MQVRLTSRGRSEVIMCLIAALRSLLPGNHIDHHERQYSRSHIVGKASPTKDGRRQQDPCGNDSPLSVEGFLCSLIVLSQSSHFTVFETRPEKCRCSIVDGGRISAVLDVPCN